MLGWFTTMAHCPSLSPPGGIAAGLVSDLLQARAITCVTMLILAIPSVSLVQSYGQSGIYRLL